MDIVKYLLSVDKHLWDTVSNNRRNPLHTASKKIIYVSIIQICKTVKKGIYKNLTMYTLGLVTTVDKSFPDF